MALSVFDLFKIGIGPSSSHTVGPMRAANTFITDLQQNASLEKVTHIQVELFGSLSATGRGHATDRAIIMGLMGETPEQVNAQAVQAKIDHVLTQKKLMLAGKHLIAFNEKTDLLFRPQFMAFHPNAMIITAFQHDEVLDKNTFYSVGGGFIVDEKETEDSPHNSHKQVDVPYPFNTAQELLELCKKHKLRVCELMMANEKMNRPEDEVREKILQIWQVMQNCVAYGISREGVLPGGLGVHRRAPRLYQSLQQNAPSNNVITDTLGPLSWVSLYALAVSEENASGGKIVTAPTNGAAGVIPAVLHYFMKYSSKTSDDDVVNFILSAAAVGILCKLNASISGAEVGCQGEIGSACAMAAAGLAEIMDATPEKLENAAEIALEHNLGLTCDPVAGLVQVPCIERNAIAAVKAINAVQLALKGSGSHFVSLDHAIRAMKETGKDMPEKYKETSLGGLAVMINRC